jgi:hypothetical protein
MPVIGFLDPYRLNERRAFARISVTPRRYRLSREVCDQCEQVSLLQLEIVDGLSRIGMGE